MRENEELKAQVEKKKQIEQELLQAQKYHVIRLFLELQKTVDIAFEEGGMKKIRNALYQAREI